MNKTAHQILEELKNGGEYRKGDPLGVLISDGRVNKVTLPLLTRELAKGSPQIRQNIVLLLEDLGLRTAPHNPDKLAVIRDHAIIKALVVEGFAKDDGAADLAARILARSCTPVDLAAFEEVYLKSLQDGRGDYLVLMTKAKTLPALALIEKMGQSPAWRNHQDKYGLIRIAQAGLGNAAVEEEFIAATREAERNAPPAPKNRFYDVGNARDGSALSSHLERLGLIGTRRTLLVACEYLRSPMKAYVANVRETAVRRAALDAIRYNYPDERVLERPNSVQDWAAVEEFCARQLGASFEGPTPEIAPPLPYPRFMPRPSSTGQRPSP